MRRLARDAYTVIKGRPAPIRLSSSRVLIYTSIGRLYLLYAVSLIYDPVPARPQSVWFIRGGESDNEMGQSRKWNEDMPVNQRWCNLIY